MLEFKKYRRKAIAELAEWNGKDLLGVSISQPDKDNGSPKTGDFIGRNPDNHDDKWLIAADYAAKNFVLIKE